MYAPTGGKKGTKKGQGKSTPSSLGSGLGTHGGRYGSGTIGLGLDSDVGTSVCLPGAKIGLNAFVLSAVEEAVQYCG